MFSCIASAALFPLVLLYFSPFEKGGLRAVSLQKKLNCYSRGGELVAGPRGLLDVRSAKCDAPLRVWIVGAADMDTDDTTQKGRGDEQASDSIYLSHLFTPIRGCSRSPDRPLPSQVTVKPEPQLQRC